jgi:hypothetical protein
VSGKHLSHNGLFLFAEFGRLGWDFGEGKRALHKAGTKLRLGCSVKIENEPLGKHDFAIFGVNRYT